MSEMNDLVCCRSLIKARIRRSGEFADQLTADKSKCDIIEVMTTLDETKSAFIELKALSLKIAPLCTDNEFTAAVKYEEEAEKMYRTVVRKLEKLLNHERSPASTSAETNSHNDIIQKLTEQNRKLSEILTANMAAPVPGGPIQVARTKLGPLTLPDFHGKYSDFTSWYDIYKSQVHNDPSLSNVQKFGYLRSSLKGLALKLVDKLPVTDANYTVALEKITKTFQKNASILKDCIREFNEQPHITNPTSNNLRELAVTSDQIISVVDSLPAEFNGRDPWLLYIMSVKLDPETKRDWSKHTSQMENPKPSDLIDFLMDRAHTFQDLDMKPTKSSVIVNRNPRSRASLSTSTNTLLICPVGCKQAHPLFRCKKFLSMKAFERRKALETIVICKRCLRNDCIYPNACDTKCRRCNGQHNVLLHVYENGEGHRSDQVVQTTKPTSIQPSPKASSSLPAQSPMPQNSLSCHSNSNNNYCLLATAIVNTMDSDGEMHTCRVVLDGGSQTHFMTEKFCNFLRLSRRSIYTSIHGIGDISTSANIECSTTIFSRSSDYAIQVPFTVMKRISNKMPDLNFETSKWKVPSHLELADPFFNVSNEVDILIGAGLAYALLKPGQIKLGPNLPVLQNTHLGWVVAGDIQLSPNHNQVVFSAIATKTDSSLETQIARFWDIEDTPNGQTPMSKEDEECENHFKATVKRTESGQFLCRMPFLPNVSSLGESRGTVLKQFLNMEKKLHAKPEVLADYQKFMDEYLNLEHMTLVAENKDSMVRTHANTPAYYLPHHAVFKTDSSTTKTRIVFNASFKTTSSLSLNDTLMVGPVVQDNLLNHILKFRRHPVAITGDIAKMYRMFLIDPADRDFLRILWRSDPQLPLQEYQLNTVTYGTACGSYLATRCLKQLGEDCAESHPKASRQMENFYVDDWTSGADTVQEAIDLKDEMKDMLQTAGMQIRKFSSNSEEFLQSCSLEDREVQLPFKFDYDDTVKTLGIRWNPSIDAFQFIVSLVENQVNTKRSILSNTAKIFDPPGLLGPIITKAKLFMQQLWEIKIDWDKSIPYTVDLCWNEFYLGLEDINQIQFPRCVINPKHRSLQLHGFCDASEKAYGACIYIVSLDENGNLLSSNLLCSKSRVAPLKKISLPRLELCGAVILSKLISFVAQIMKLQFSSIYAWTDSTIVLAWLAKPPNSWKTFIANRVTEIQTLLAPMNWHHVASMDNPADILSRGCDASDLIDNHLWLHGPFHRSNRFIAPKDNLIEPTIIQCQQIESETRKIIQSHLIQNNDLIQSLIHRFSSISKIERILVFVFRFYSKVRNPIGRPSRILSSSQIVNATQNTFVTRDEIWNVLTTIIRLVQQASFASEIECLANNRPLNVNSKLLNLTPFLDQSKLLRVGGRNHHGNFSENQRHQIILPSDSQLTTLLMEREHKRLLHAAPLLLLGHFRNTYWPLNGRRLAKRIYHNCVTCFRTNPTIQHQIMGSLPRERIDFERPFLNAGVDFGGPITTLKSSGRGAKTDKSYICLFVCFATRATHIEAVSDLSSEAFLAALHRLGSRRGYPENIYSDQGKNFKGADRKIEQQFKELIGLSRVQNCLASWQIKWHFIPQNSPHMGGLWEAGIKSTKAHLKRVMGNNTLTFEEFTTLLCQIESCLNSRPLTPISTEPNDLEPLTPGHFLIGAPLVSIREPDITSVPNNRLPRWKVVQQKFQHFWKRWSSEYVNNLQQKLKWKTASANLKIDEMVLIKDDNLPPLKWSLGRVLEIHPGVDHHVRVVTLRTPSGIVQRTIHKLCKLPIHTDEAWNSPNQEEI